MVKRIKTPDAVHRGYYLPKDVIRLINDNTSETFRPSQLVAHAIRSMYEDKEGEDKGDA